MWSRSKAQRAVPVAAVTSWATVYSDTLTRPLHIEPRLPAGLPAIFASRYRVIGELGAGAMGMVFEAQDLELDRVVALKLVQSRVSDRRLAQHRLRQVPSGAQVAE
jgi:hypothetical protein